MDRSGCTIWGLESFSRISLDVSLIPVFSPPSFSSAEEKKKIGNEKTATTSIIIAPITSICFSKDTKCICMSTLDSTVRLIEKSSGKIINEYRGHQNKAIRMNSSFNCTDSKIVSGSEDGVVVIWDLVESSAEKSTRLKGHSAAISHVECHKEQPNVLLSSSIDGVTRLWQ